MDSPSQSIAKHERDKKPYINRRTLNAKKDDDDDADSDDEDGPNGSNSTSKSNVLVRRTISKDDGQRIQPHNPNIAAVNAHNLLTSTKSPKKLASDMLKKGKQTNKEPLDVASYSLNVTPDQVSKVLKIEDNISEPKKKPGKPQPKTWWPDAFYFGLLDSFFIPWLTVSSKIGMFGIVVLAALIAILYEYVKFYRNSYLYWVCRDGHVHCSTQLSTSGKTSGQSNYKYKPEEMVELQMLMYANARCKQTILNGIQVFLSFLLIMSFMTMNLWVALGIFVGTFIGFFLFSCRLPYFCKDFSDYAEY